MRDFLIFGKEPFVREGYLLNSLGLSHDTVKYWKKIKLPCERMQGQIYWQYSAIPPRTRSVLPWQDATELLDKAREEEVNQQEIESQKQSCKLYEQLHKAQAIGFADYRRMYDSYGPEKARVYAKKHSVWAKLLYFNQTKYKPAQLFAAYELLEPGAYKSAASFGNTLRAARKAGEAGDFTSFVRHGNEGNQSAKTSLLEHEYWVRLLVSMGKGYEAPAIFEKVNEVCAQMSVKPIGSVSWVKYYLALPEVMFATDGYRYGLSYERQQLPYLPLESALYANDQWQIDGWTVPFYHVVKERTKAGKLTDYYRRLTVFVVRDAHSRKVLGYAFGERENTALILQALRAAVENTGTVPAEIVSDNHSFNQTAEADYLKQTLEDLGTKWTVTMNPQHKALVERYFNLFDERFCKDIQGWVGGSPHNRKRNARPKQELKDEYLKPAYSRSREGVIALVTGLIEKANDSATNNRKGLTPCECYDLSKQPNARPVDALEQVLLFWKTARCTVRRGMVTLERNGHKHYYTLPNEWQAQLYKQPVLVRYDDDFTAVQLFDAKTEASLCRIERVRPVHGALANQQSEDLSGYAAHGHRLKAGKEARRADNEALRDAVDELYGELPYELMNPATTQKDLYQTGRAQHEIGQVLKAHDVREETLVPVAQIDPLKGTVFSRTARQAATAAKPSPFTEPATLRQIPHDEGWEDEE